MALDRYKAHAGPFHGFTDRFGVIAIILPAFAIGRDKAGHHDADPVAERDKLPAPMMGAGTGFHPDQAGRLLGQEGQQFGATEGFPEHGLAPSIDPVQTKAMLCQINTNGSNVHDDSSSSVD